MNAGIARPVTDQMTGDTLPRDAMIADADKGLDRDSKVGIDRVQAIWREFMFTVDQSLRRWLAL